MTDGKLRAEWFWVERWMTSRAWELPLEARGLYREMLSQAWVRGGRLPASPAVVQRLCGVTTDEWERCWPLVRGFWKTNGDTIYNPTQQEVMADSMERKEAAKALGKRRAATAKRGKGGRFAPTSGGPSGGVSERSSAGPANHQPPSPSLSPSPSPSPITEEDPPLPPQGGGDLHDAGEGDQGTGILNRILATTHNRRQPRNGSKGEDRYLRTIAWYASYLRGLVPDEDLERAQTGANTPGDFLYALDPPRIEALADRVSIAAPDAKPAYLRTALAQEWLDFMSECRENGQTHQNGGGA